jgi:hypothetical protein
MNRHPICVHLATLLIASGFCYPLAASAQASTADPKTTHPAQCGVPPDTLHTLYLRNATQITDANELYTALRQMLAPQTKTFFVPNQMAIEICADQEQIALAEKMLIELDRPKQNYRVTYTVDEMDGTRRVGSQHFSMIVTPGQDSTLKQGSRIPVVTGSFNDKNSTQQNQMTYIDIGMNFTAAIDSTAAGIRLRTTVEQSSLAEEKSGVGPQDPVIRQAMFRGTSYLSAGKPLKLGTLDIPDTTHHLNLEATMEPLP